MSIMLQQSSEFYRQCHQGWFCGTTLGLRMLIKNVM